MRHFFKACLVVLLALSVVGLSAQTKRPGMTPIEFNDQLTSITDSLALRGRQWGQQFIKARKTKTYTRLKPYRVSLERFIDKSIARVKVMKDVENSQEFRMTMIRFLEYEKKMITEAFKPIEQLKPTASKEEVNAAFGKLQAFTASENAELAKVGAAQETYGKENGFRIETVEEEAGKEKP